MLWMSTIYAGVASATLTAYGSSFSECGAAMPEKGEYCAGRVGMHPSHELTCAQLAKQILDWLRQRVVEPTDLRPSG
jgi:hypothetical protein